MFTSFYTIAQLAANIATVLFAAVIIFQLLLALGLVPVSMAFGGRQSELTIGLRLASIAAAVILGLFVLIIRRRAGLPGDETTLFIRIFSWVVTAYMAFNTFTNITSKSRIERLIFTPTTVILTIASFIVSIS